MEKFVELVSKYVGIASQLYSKASQSSWWPIASWLVGAILFLVTVFRVWVIYRQYIIKKRAENAARSQDEDLRLHWFREQDFSLAVRDYITPFCSNVDPTDRDDLRDTVAVREPIFDALERELADQDRRHILILADSGMGKTTLLLNLVSRERKRYRFALIPLGEQGAIDRIKGIPNQRDTVLLLDAFDEDPRAIEDATSRMEELMTLSAPFKSVVMTCRTQFFPSDATIPRQTGIKRIASRRAGTPVVYQWRTVYLQPFDRKQISMYVRGTIPWYRLEGRRKANKIVSDISDLAARPMLTALIPKLVEARRSAHSLWDLYAFMVDTWIERESWWIEPALLRDVSKKIAVDLIANRSSRGAERISRDQLIALAGIAQNGIEAWQLTSRSLLNRDADGHYKFAHRSILEFFFIEAFLQGDDRCADYKWTDMMCDLFLSWGSSSVADEARAIALLSIDLRTTGLFPVVERHEPSGRLDASWVKGVFSERSSSSARAKFPDAWRSEVAHVESLMTMSRAYDLADGLVWHIDVTIDISDRENRSIYHHNRYSLTGQDALGRRWEVTSLYELKLLCDIFAKQSILHSTIDERELYWLSDHDGVHSALARVREGVTGDAITYPDLELVQSGSSRTSQSYTIDVYRVPTKGVAVNKIRAMTILAHHGDAAALFEAERPRDAPSAWGIRREPSPWSGTAR